MEEEETNYSSYDNSEFEEDLEDIEARLYSQIHYAFEEPNTDIPGDLTSTVTQSVEFGGEIWEQVTSACSINTYTGENTCLSIGSHKHKGSEIEKSVLEHSASKEAKKDKILSTLKGKLTRNGDIVIIESDSDSAKSVITVDSSDSAATLPGDDTRQTISSASVIDLDEYYSSSSSSDEIDLDDYYTSSDSYSSSNGSDHDGDSRQPCEQSKHPLSWSSSEDSDSDIMDLGEEQGLDKMQLNLAVGAGPDDGQLEDLQQVHDSLPDCDWSIGYRDRATTGAVTMSNRYYSIINVTCKNCSQKGHLSKVCPKPKKAVCILCSDKSHHWRACPNSLCYNCYSQGHAAKECKKPRRSRHFYCTRCRMKGHSYMECPDLWRQYHVTTEPGKLCKGKMKKHPREDISCFNCGETGHYGHECEEEMMTHYGLPVLPFIARYAKHDKPGKLKRKEKSKGKVESSGKHKKSKSKKDHKVDRNVGLKTEKSKKSHRSKIPDTAELAEMPGLDKTAVSVENLHKKKHKHHKKSKRIFHKKDCIIIDGEAEITSKHKKTEKKIHRQPGYRGFVSADLTAEVRKYENRGDRGNSKKRKLHHCDRELFPGPQQKRVKRKKQTRETDSPVKHRSSASVTKFTAKDSRKNVRSWTMQEKDSHSKRKRLAHWNSKMGCTFQANSNSQKDVFLHTFMNGYEKIFD